MNFETGEFETFYDKLSFRDAIETGKYVPVPKEYKTELAKLMKEYESRGEKLRASDLPEGDFKDWAMTNMKPKMIIPSKKRKRKRP